MTKNNTHQKSSEKAFIPFGLLCASLLLLSQTGCVTVSKGTADTPGQSSAERKERVDTIEDVIITTVAENNRIVAHCSAVGSHSLVEIVPQRKMAIGLFPGFRSAIDRDAVAEFPFVVILGHCLVGAPTIASLFVSPFLEEYRDSSEHTQQISAYGIIGIHKYTTKEPNAFNSGNRVVQSGFRRTVPLANVKVLCSIPEMSFRDEGTTDAKGDCTFLVNTTPNRGATVNLVMNGTGNNEYARYLTPFIGKEQTSSQVLTTPPNRLVVQFNSEPSGANIYQDGTMIGQTPCSLTYTVPADSYNKECMNVRRLTATHDGFLPVEFSPNIPIDAVWKNQSDQTITSSKGVLFILQRDPNDRRPIVVQNVVSGGGNTQTTTETQTIVVKQDPHYGKEWEDGMKAVGNVVRPYSKVGPVETEERIKALKGIGTLIDLMK